MRKINQKSWLTSYSHQHYLSSPSCSYPWTLWLLEGSSTCLPALKQQMLLLLPLNRSLDATPQSTVNWKELYVTHIHTAAINKLFNFDATGENTYSQGPEKFLACKKKGHSPACPEDSPRYPCPVITLSCHLPTACFHNDLLAAIIEYCAEQRNRIHRSIT